MIKSPTPKEIKSYEFAPAIIDSIIAGLNNKQLHYQPGDNEWSINQVIVHLADTEMFFCERMRKVIVEEKPTLQSFDQAEWAKKLIYEKQDYRLALDLLKTQRKCLASLLHLLPSSFWKRKGIRDGKEVTLYDIFTTALNHIPTHLAQIESIKSNLNFPSN